MFCHCFRDLFDFLTICFYEYEHFFKDHQALILVNRDLTRDLLPLAYDIVYNHIREVVTSILEALPHYTNFASICVGGSYAPPPP
jgi:hypothetical protein